MDRHDWDRRYAGRELVWTAEPNRFLVAEVADLAPGRALDLACGEGRNAVWLAERGWRVCGVEFSQVALDKCRQMAAARGVELELVEADVREVELEPRSFDLVAILYLHMPWPDMCAALTRAVDALAPGGDLLVVGHDRDNLEHGVGGPQSPDVLYGPEDIAAELHGLTILSARQVERPVAPACDRPSHAHTGPAGGVAIDCLVRARRPP